MRKIMSLVMILIIIVSGCSGGSPSSTPPDTIPKEPSVNMILILGNLGSAMTGRDINTVLSYYDNPMVFTDTSNQKYSYTKSDLQSLFQTLFDRVRPIFNYDFTFIKNLSVTDDIIVAQYSVDIAAWESSRVENSSTQQITIQKIDGNWMITNQQILSTTNTSTLYLVGLQ
jgi:ketosteroid isomerase-like protein